MAKHQEYYQQFAENGDLTAEQAAQLLELDPEGDIDDVSNSGEPDPELDTSNEPEGDHTPETPAEPAAGEEPNQETVDPDNEVDPSKAAILAKDGKHLISYDKLVDARQEAQQSKQAAEDYRVRLEQAEARIAEMQEKAQERADSGQAPTKTDENLNIAQQAIEQGVDPAVFGDFSDEALAKGIHTLVDSRVAQMVEAKVAERMADIQKKLEPLEQRQQESEIEKHYRQIYEVHPDAESVIESQELAAWLENQDEIARGAYQAALEKGTAAQVIKVFDAFKKSTAAVTPAEDAPKDVKATAKAAIDSVKPSVPGSLSDIPGAARGPVDKNQLLESLDPSDLTERLVDMSPEQIEAYLNRNL